MSADLLVLRLSDTSSGSRGSRASHPSEDGRDGQRGEILTLEWRDVDRAGVALITVGVERQGLRLSLSHIAEGEWRAQFMGNPLVALKRFGVAETPWRAVQLRAWQVVQRDL